MRGADVVAFFVSFFFRAPAPAQATASADIHQAPENRRTPANGNKSPPCPPR